MVRIREDVPGWAKLQAGWAKMVRRREDVPG